MEHTERMRVQWVDTDASGLIHYTAALRYFEVVEHALVRRLFGEAGWSDRDFSLPRVHVECDYRAPLRYPDEFECSARVAAVGNTSVTFAYRAHRLDGELALEGRIVAVAVGPDGAKRPLPDAFRAVFTRAVRDADSAGAP